MKKRKAVLTVLLAVGMLAGCAGRGGSSTPEQDSSRIFVTEEGNLQTVVVEAFTDRDRNNQEYFSEEDMKSEIEKEILAYNAAHGGSSVTVDSCTIGKDSASVVLNYGSGEELTAFAKEYDDKANQLDSITVSPLSEVTAQMEAEGVRLLKADGKAADLNKLKEKGEYRAVVVEGSNPVTIQTQVRFLFVSDNVMLKDRYTVQTAMGKSYIIFK